MKFKKKVSSLLITAVFPVSGLVSAYKTYRNTLFC